MYVSPKTWPSLVSCITKTCFHLLASISDNINVFYLYYTLIEHSGKKTNTKSRKEKKLPHFIACVLLKTSALTPPTFLTATRPQSVSTVNTIL